MYVIFSEMFLTANPSHLFALDLKIWFLPGTELSTGWNCPAYAVSLWCSSVHGLLSSFVVVRSWDGHLVVHRKAHVSECFRKAQKILCAFRNCQVSN